MGRLSILFCLFALLAIDVAQTAADARGSKNWIGYQRRLRESRAMIGHPHTHPYVIRRHHRHW